MGANPVGFEALNIARIEAGLLFFGQDMTGNETPTELGLEFTVEVIITILGANHVLEKSKKTKNKDSWNGYFPSVSLLGNEKLLINGKLVA